MIQGSPEWFAARLGKVTASKVADVMATTKSGPAASRQNYMMDLLCQRLTGTIEQGFTNAAMQRGTEMEPIARSAYEARNGLFVTEVGLIDHPTLEGFAASPDGLVGDDGMIEIKNPNTATHIAFMRTGKPDGRYIWQMLAQMACTGRAWCDFVSFDDRLPEPLQFASVRIMRDDAKIADMLAGVTAFLKELADLEAEMLKRMKQ
jgi:putative phage-type endonuclease